MAATRRERELTRHEFMIPWCVSPPVRGAPFLFSRIERSSYLRFFTVNRLYFMPAATCLPLPWRSRGRMSLSETYRALVSGTRWALILRLGWY